MSLESAAAHRALLIEDYDELRFVYERLLGRLGFEVHAFAHPVEALTQFAKGLPPPDLIVTDWSLPGMTGTTLIESLKEKGLPESTALLVISAATPPEEELQGATFLMKPFDIARFDAAVRRARGGSGDQRPLTAE
ncbi:MAG: two-component system response regulator [Myxococcaceae bacterium]